MKTFILGLGAAAMLALAVPAVAQQAPAPAAPAAKPAAKVAIPTKTFYRGQEASQYLVRDRLLGAKVLNKDGQTIGDIEDLIISAKGNEIEGVIMGVGGFLGVGEKKVGVRLSALKIDSKDGKTTVSLPAASKEVLAALDPYQRAVPKKTLTERAKDAAKVAGDAAKKAYDKAKDAMAKPAEAPAPATPAAPKQ